MTEIRINREYKDRLFRLVFHEKKDLLDLYNAINNSDYTDPEALEITTIEDVVYMGMKNDLSFIIGNVMNLYEHQSSYSPNLPLRGFFYFASLYKDYVEPHRRALYSTLPVRIPFPQYIVFYNGTACEPERQEQKLSTLFLHSQTDMEPSLECTATILNINYGHNRVLMEKCRALKEYAMFIALLRKYVAEGIPIAHAVDRTVDECIQQEILSDILRKNRAEVTMDILTEWDEEGFREFLQEEAAAKGHAEGRAEGIAATIEVMRDLDIPKEMIEKKIVEKFSVSPEEARTYVKKYWR